MRVKDGEQMISIATFAAVAVSVVLQMTGDVGDHERCNSQTV
jgi:hypothetical protein